MRRRTANWFLCNIRYEKTMEDGMEKKVTEQFVVNALSFTEAEANIIHEMQSYISGEYNIEEIDRCPWGEVFFDDKKNSDKWYKSKLQFITFDEKTEKEKKTTVNYLVQGATLEEARKNIDEVMGGTMIDYTISSVSETKILDVYEVIMDKS